MINERPWFLYIVRCSDGSLYTGISVNVRRRVEEHNAGRGARYTASRRPVELLAVWRYPDHQSALQAEVALKAKNRRRKTQLIQAEREYRGGSWQPGVICTAE